MTKNLGLKGKLGIAAIVAVLVGGTSAFAVSSSAAAEITQDEAKKIALSKVAGATEKDITKVKKDIDNDREEYDVEIVYDGYEYDFEISAKDGKVFDQSKEKMDAEDVAEAKAEQAAKEESSKSSGKAEVVSSSSSSSSGSSSSSSSSSGGESKPASSSSSSSSSAPADIGLEKAKSIALGQQSGTVTKAVKDYDDGRAEYDIEIKSGDYEYEFEIDAASGKILSKDVDRIEPDDDDDDDDRYDD